MSQIIFSLPEYKHIAQVFCDRPGCVTGEIERKHFPDSERYLRLLTSVDGQDVIFVGGTWSDSATLEIYDLGCAIAKYGARSLTFVIPYFGCSTMERATKEGEVVTAKTRARLLSAVPQTHAGNRALLLDLHSEGIPHYFEGDISVTHVYAKPLIHRAVDTMIQDLGNGAPAVLASTDAGRAKWVESLANDMSLPAAFIMKRRISGSQTKVVGVNADVKDKLVIIYDDMIRTGGSLIEAATAYKTAGASNVCAIATHGILPGASWDKIIGSGAIERVALTDSHPRSMELAQSADSFLKVYPTAELFVPFLKLG
jgi:ribose-phosphate pyrophosphokinase